MNPHLNPEFKKERKPLEGNRDDISNGKSSDLLCRYGIIYL